jgi:hypothetical protein
LKIRNGRHEWIRTNDRFRVKASIPHTFNYLQDAGDCQNTRKYVEDEILAGDFTGDAASDFAQSKPFRGFTSVLIHIRGGGVREPLHKSVTRGIFE